MENVLGKRAREEGDDDGSLVQPIHQQLSQPISLELSCQISTSPVILPPAETQNCVDSDEKEHGEDEAHSASDSASQSPKTSSLLPLYATHNTPVTAQVFFTALPLCSAVRIVGMSCRLQQVVLRKHIRIPAGTASNTSGLRLQENGRLAFAFATHFGAHLEVAVEVLHGSVTLAEQAILVQAPHGHVFLSLCRFSRQDVRNQECHLVPPEKGVREAENSIRLTACRSS